MHKATSGDLSTEIIDILVMAARQGDSAAQAQLIAHFYPRIFRYTALRVKQPEDAEDLTHDVFIRMLASLKQQQGSFAAWLYRIAGNRIVDYYRKLAVRSQVVAAGKTIESFGSMDGILEKRFLQEELHHGIRRLTGEQQEVIILRFIEGYQANEVAEILGKSPTAVRQLQFRALQQLRKIIPADKNK